MRKRDRPERKVNARNGDKVELVGFTEIEANDILRKLRMYYHGRIELEPTGEKTEWKICLVRTNKKLADIRQPPIHSGVIEDYIKHIWMRDH